MRRSQVLEREFLWENVFWSRDRMYSQSEYVWNETLSASKPPYSWLGERSLCAISSACRKSLLRATRLRVQEEGCWRVRTGGFVWPPSRVCVGYPELPDVPSVSPASCISHMRFCRQLVTDVIP